ncbi:hypothetical protein I552_1428 [Mycobacterium xenopi 3993]|nr:hypothetical protein I552_1428 [Mycobacterium xenopi 3993]
MPSLRSHTHGRHVPHVSYAVLRSWDQTAVTAALEEIAAGSPVELCFDGVGLFRRGRMWLVAGVGADFVARQARVVAAVTATGAELHKHYVPGSGCRIVRLRRARCWRSCRWSSVRCSTCCRCTPDWTVPHWSTARRGDPGAGDDAVIGYAWAGIVTADAVWCLVVAFKVSNNST